MQVGSTAGSLQSQVSMGITKKAQDTGAALVDNLMSKSLDGTSEMNQALASRGVGTQLNTVA